MQIDWSALQQEAERYGGVSRPFTLPIRECCGLNQEANCHGGFLRLREWIGALLFSVEFVYPAGRCSACGRQQYVNLSAEHKVCRYCGADLVPVDVEP